MKVSFAERPEYLFVGGAAYFKEGEPITLERIADVSLMPSFCHSRIYPRLVGGKWMHSCIYVKMPLLLASWSWGSRGVSFPVYAGIEGGRVPLCFSLYSSEEGVVFELGITSEEEVLRRRAKDYADWIVPEVKLEKDRIGRSLAGRTVSLELSRHFGEDWQTLARETSERLLKGITPKLDLPHHLRKSINWLNRAFDPEENVFLFGIRRDRAEPAGGYWTLPTYTTLASDIYALSMKASDEAVSEMSLAAKELALVADASGLVNGGRVWHNTARFDSRSGRLAFYDHLGTGIGGYPGGQGTILRSLIERALLGDRDPRLETVVREGLDWLLFSMFPDGHWARTYRVFDDTSDFELETGEGSYSVGGNSEGAIALILAYRLFRDRKYLDGARRAVEWVNRFADGGVITSGYLRDSKQDEVDGVSAIFATEANLLLHDLTGDNLFLRKGLEFATYLLTWQRLWDVPAFDTLLFSFSPRVATCETAWLAHAYHRVYSSTGEDFWLRQSEIAFSSLKGEDEFEGYGEASYYDENLVLHPLQFDAVYSANAVLRYCMARMKQEKIELEVKSRRLYREYRRQMRRSLARKGWDKVRRTIG